MKLVFILGIAAISLAACATPEERCGNRASRDYRDLVSEIAETEMNIERGYSETIERVLTSGSYEVHSIDRYVTFTREIEVENITHVPIDPVAEQQKLESLRARLGPVTLIRDQGVAQCRRSYAG